MKQKIIALLILLSGILIAAPVFIHADTTGPIGLITCATHYNKPGTPVPGVLSPMTDICSICDLLALLQTGFNFVWRDLSIPLAAVMMLYGGSLMMFSAFTADANLATKGRKVLWNAVLGLVIVLVAWIAVDSILKILGAQFGTGNFGPWNTIKCDAGSIPVIGGPVDVIPPELACPAGATTRDVNGFDVCNTDVQRSIVSHSSLLGARSGSCAPANIDPSIDAIITTAAQQNNINPNRLRSLILIESSGNRNVRVSSAGACGMAQVLPSTARQSCAALQDPRVGIPAGAAEYARLLQACGGSNDCAAAGYNGGPGANLPSRDCGNGVTRYQCEFDNPDHTIRNTGYQPTRNYVRDLNSCQAQLGG